MTELRTVERPCNIKVNDSGTKIQFYAYDDNGRISFTQNDTLLFKIKNSMGYVTEVQGQSSSGGYIAELNSSDLQVLTPDTYFIELWVTQNGNTTIYPDNAFCPIAVTQNVMSIAGNVLPTTSLASFENSLKAYVEQQASTATTNIKNDFQSYVDSITDSTIKTAEKASSDAQSAISTANIAKSTAESAVSTANTANQKSTANASLITANNTLIQTNTNSINGGLYLSRAKSYAQINTSKNLVVNSEFQDMDTNTDPYTNWAKSWGWYYTDSGDRVKRTNRSGDVLQTIGINKNSSIISTALCAGNINQPTVYSASFKYEKYGSFDATDIISVYLEYAYQADFTGSNKILLGQITSDSTTTGVITKENITVPQHYDWIRLRIEGNQDSVRGYIFFGHPMVNYGATIQEYCMSNLPGQRISKLENQLAQLGGTNLLLNTLTMSGDGWCTSSNTQLSYNGVKVQPVSDDWWNVRYSYQKLYDMGIALDTQNTYCFSCFVKKEEGCNATISFFGNVNVIENHTIDVKLSTDYYQQIYVTFKFKDPSEVDLSNQYGNALRFEQGNSDGKTHLYYTMYQLERGTKPTYWNISPYDIQNIMTAQSVMLTQMANIQSGINTSKGSGS